MNLWHSNDLRTSQAKIRPKSNNNPYSKHKANTVSKHLKKVLLSFPNQIAPKYLINYYPSTIPRALTPPKLLFIQNQHPRALEWLYIRTHAQASGISTVTRHFPN
jgi:hypothetical protein